MRLTTSSLAAAAMATAIVAGCSTTSSPPTHQGTSSQVVFPDKASAWPAQGTFANLDNLRQLRPGMTKDQHYALIGRPHFKEGMLDVREWDYLFNFRTGNAALDDVVQCQMKVLFDTDMLSRSYYWAPESCASFLKYPDTPAPAAPAVMPAVTERTTTLGADALFAFNGSGPADLLPGGRRLVDALGRELAAMKSLRHVDVYAYTDRLGSAAYNQRLAQRRAETVKNLLVARGVDSRVVTAQGRGEANPVSRCGAMPRTRLIACLAPDRRVEIRSTGVK
ncbi:outer membrane protein assembly factor BamE [Cupriavidus sp. WKF15]|uniref:outer membrane protein assembly factor BamE domain-containing protein n=1 Tax=Cupriavidus sp. WKF15 TaxID=3032282 RepID=UPI0023E25BB4|nr:outer membrane protein assembly factor BamE [Cupriavidus sp. WKF15]WER49887.1 outer membrane protein assembly factor BamE [Cupriavidus sp. WKF15]